MKLELRKRFGQISFSIWKRIAQPLDRRYQDFDTRMFLSNEMDPRFPSKEYISKKNPYFRKWGFDVSQLDAAYYSRVSGIDADHYVTRSMAIHFIYPYLDRYGFLDAYMDKNVQKKVLGLDSDNPLGIRATEDIIRNMNGIFMDQEGKQIPEDQAVSILMSYGAPMILKPSVETYGGHGVVKVSADVTVDELKSLMKKYWQNYTFQKLIVQHPVLSSFNPTSVNTVRVVTYRDPSKKKKILYSCVRFGGEGSVIDNVCSGGGYTGIDISTGRLKNRKRYSYFTMDVPMLPDSAPDQIPCWDKIKEAALYLHDRLPHFDIAGWDFSVTPDGDVLFVEYNLRPGVGLQQAVGPMFSKEDLDELMKHVSKVKYGYQAFGVLRYKDQPDRKTVHIRMG